MKLNRKKTLITSLIAMILCMVMLAGATYAAFTETNTATITVGTSSFDMAVLYTKNAQDDSDGINWSDEETVAAINGTATITGLQFSGWENKYYFFQVTNAGDLPFDLTVSTEVEGSDTLRAKAKVSVTGVATTIMSAPATVAADKLDDLTQEMAKDAVYYVCVQISCGELTGGVDYGSLTITVTFTADQVVA